MVILNADSIADLEKAREKLEDKLASSAKKDRAFPKALETALKTDDQALDYIKEGQALASRNLDLKAEPRFKNPNSKKRLATLFDTAMSFFIHKDSLVAKKERKAKISDAIMGLGEGMAKRIAKVRSDAMVIFDSIKTQVLKSASSVGSDLRSFFISGDAKPDFVDNLQNPLLDFGDEVRYSQIKPEHFVPAAKEAQRRVEKAMEELKTLADETEHDSGKLDYDNTARAIDEMQSFLNKTHILMYHLSIMNQRPELVDAYREAEKIIVPLDAAIASEPKLYKLLERVSSKPEYQSWPADRKRYLEVLKQNMELSGVNLAESDRKRVSEIKQEMATCTTNYIQNVTRSRMDIVIQDSSRLEGVPPRIMGMLQKNTEALKKALRKKLEAAGHDSIDAEIKARISEGALVISDGQAGSVLSYVKDEALRKEIWFAQNQKAVDGEHGRANEGVLQVGEQAESFDNSENMEKILRLRQELAEKVGFSDYAELANVTKMTENADAAIEFLEDLATRARPKAEAEMEKLVAFQKSSGISQDEVIKPWNFSLVDRMYREEEFDYDGEEIKKYFELDKTLGKIFDLFSRLYSIRFEPAEDFETWDDEVRSYKIVDAKTNERLGNFFLDMFKRDYKKPGGWHQAMRRRNEERDGSITLPQAVVATNYAKQADGKPFLMSFDQVRTMMHELGHVMHGILTKSKIDYLSGTAVDRDYVELPSQLQENFFWDKDIMRSLSENKDGQQLPEDLVDRLIESRKFGAGDGVLLRARIMLLDLLAHKNQKNGKAIMEQWKELQDKYNLCGHIDDSFYPYKYSHMFGGYAGGVYSYTWANMLDADAFTPFKEDGVLSSKVGKRFREEIFETGNLRTAAQSFRAFMGREPQIDAYLAKIGLSE